MVQAAGGHVRIGELSRRVGVPPELLRAWEQRYSLLEPSRSPGGFRLYSSDDEERVRVMQGFLREGFSAAEAARLALAGPVVVARPDPTPELDTGREALSAALDQFDDAGANRAFDGLLAAFDTETVLGEVVLPYLQELGARWERGEASIAQEHFASNILRGRLLGLARGWGQGTGPRALLACAPGELHDLALIVFGIALRARGWRVTYLGPDTPFDTLDDAAARLEPDLVVMTASTSTTLRDAVTDLRRLGRRTRLALAGNGPDAGLAAKTGAELLTSDPVAEAERLARA